MKKKKAFTLSELMLATAIITIAISGLLAAFVGCLLLNESNNNLVTASNDAQYVLEQIKGLAYSNIVNNYTPTPSNFTNNNIIFTPTVTVNEIILNRVKEVTVNVAWVERQKNRNFSLSTRIAH